MTVSTLNCPWRNSGARGDRNLKRRPLGRSRFLALLPMTIAPAVSDAEETEYFVGFDLVSNYVSNGVTQSNDNPALQGYFELARGGFYAGTWMSRVDFGDDDRIEIDLYLGYRHLFENDLFLDFGYAQYLYDDTGNCCGEFKLTVGYPVHEDVGLKAYVAYNPETEFFNRNLSIGYAATDQWNFDAKIGYTDFYAHRYWNVGTYYTFNDFWSFRLTYEGSDSDDAGLVAGVSLANTQDVLFRFLAAPFQR